MEQYFHWIPTFAVIAAIFLTRFDTKTFQDLAGFDIQKSATKLSIQTVTETVGILFSAEHIFLVMFAAIWPLINSSLGIEVFLFEILDFDVRRPFTSSCRLFNYRYCYTRTHQVTGVRKNVEMKSFFLRFFTIARGTFTFLSCLVHRNQSSLKGSDTFEFQLLFSSQTSLKILFPSAMVGEAIPNGSYIFPR